MRSLFDFCGCVIGGCATPPSWPLDRAGGLAACAHFGDQDDLHLGSGAHPGGVVWSAVCACTGDASVADAFAAAAFGYELTIRLAEGLAPERQRWHVTPVAGVVGAAGAAARLLDADQADAVAHAVSIAGGSSHALVERTGTRFLHRAHAATSGVACARASAVLPASRLGLESGRGAFAEADAGVMLAPRASTCLEETGFRLHPATGFAQAAIEAAATLAPLRPHEVEHVTATVSPPAAIALASNPEPSGREEEWWSIEHAVGVALVGGLELPEVAGLRSRVELVPGDAGWGARVEVSLRDGTVRSAAVDGPRPASDDDLRKKWLRLTGEDGAAFFDRLLAADDGELFAPLVALLP